MKGLESGLVLRLGLGLGLGLALPLFSKPTRAGAKGSPRLCAAFTA
jgi:hypothetical protein